MERSFVIGSAAMDEKSVWARVGELGLQKRVLNTDPSSVTFGELAEKYLADFPFNKKSTRDLNRQVLRRALNLACEWGKLERRPRLSLAKGERQR